MRPTCGQLDPLDGPEWGRGRDLAVQNSSTFLALEIYPPNLSSKSGRPVAVFVLYHSPRTHYEHFQPVRARRLPFARQTAAIVDQTTVPFEKDPAVSHVDEAQ